MGDTNCEVRRMSHVARIDDPIFLCLQAKTWTREMVEHEWLRGPDDKIEAVAHRIQLKYGAQASIIRQLWNRPPREMKVSRWMNVFQAYVRFCERRARANYEEKRAEAADLCHPAWLRLADLVAGRSGEEEGEQSPSQLPQVNRSASNDRV